MAGVFHPAPFTTMCHVRSQNGTNLQENTFAFHWSSPVPSVGELTTLAGLLAVGLSNAIRASTWVGIIFREIYCRNIDTEVANEATFTFPSGSAGGRIGNPLAANEACGIVKRTGQTGRGQHGRNSMSNFVESDVDGNSIGSSLMALLGNIAIQVLISYLSGRFDPAVAHIPRTTGGIGGSTPLTSAIVLDSNVDSQKTRLNSHGR